MMGRAVVLLLAAAFVARGEDPPWVERSYRKTFDQLLTDGRYVEAEANARTELGEAEETFGRDSVMAALALDMLIEAFAYSDHVRDPEAEQIGLRAVAIKEKALSPLHPQVAVSLRMLANLLVVQGDYERARAYYERAVALHEKTAGQDPRQEANALHALGALLIKSGDFSEARSALERALAIRMKNFPPNTLNTATILSNYAVVLRETQEYEKSRENFLRAVAIFEKTLGPDHVIVTECLTEYGSLLNRMGRPAEAKAALERSLAIEEKAYGPNHVDLAFVLSNLARSYAALGETGRARPLYERALAIATGVYGGTHPEVARILGVYAQLLLRVGENGPALQAALRTEEIGRDHLAATIRSLPERQALRYAATRATAMDVLMRIALREPAARGVVYDAVVRSRALVFDEMAARHQLIANAEDGEIVRLSRELAAARGELSRLLVQGPARFPRDGYRAALDRARTRTDQAERALTQSSSGYRDEINRRGAGASDVSAALDRSDALVSFVRYGTPASYAAFVLRPGRRDPALMALGPATSLDALVEGLRRRIEEQAEAPDRPSAALEERYRRAGDTLRQRVWDPLLPALAGVQRVFVTPEGALNLIDFGALPDDRGGYVVEHGPLLHYVSAERDLIPAGPVVIGKGLLAVGAPSFDRMPRERQLVAARDRTPVFRGSGPRCSEFAGWRFEALPASFEEVREISTLWRRFGEGGAVRLTGDGASEAAFKEKAAGKQVIHIAAHGFFTGGGCVAAHGEAGENPLLLSGVALAGANRRQTSSPDSEDGIVTAEEIAALNLEGVKWAVLSACETGVGKVLAGEGVFGLRRAFQVAGARTVIMSLWPVADVATQRWMIALYRHRVTRRLDTAASLRAASLETIARLRKEGLSTHPFYWGGFIAVGDWR